jgi:hypothetical protein
MGTTSGVGLVLPNSLSDQNVDGGLLQKRWNDNKLYLESLQPDPLFSSTDLTHVVQVGSGKNIIGMADSVFLDLTPKDKKGKGARSITLAFMKAFNNDPIEGNGTELLGSEENVELKFFTQYANDWAVGISEETFGIDFREMSPYGVYQQIRGGLGRWLGELRGYYARTALVTTMSANLTSAPVSLTSALNPVSYVAARGLGNQPIYYSTLASYQDAVGDQLELANATALMTVPELLKMTDYAWATKYIEPVTIDGRQMYIYLCPVEQYRRLNDPSVSNSWRSSMESVVRSSAVEKAVPGAKMIIDDKLIIVRDPRCPTCVKSGTASNYTLTFGYMKMGRNDTRSTGVTANDFDVGFLLGRGSLAKYEPELPHYEDQYDVYTKYKGNGLFGGVGYMTPIWDLDSADQTDSSAQQESSMLVFTSRTSTG